VTSQRQCRNCAYWQQPALGYYEIMATANEGETRTVRGGTCQRYPPAPSGFCTTREDDWCGEFTSKEEAK